MTYGDGKEKTKDNRCAAMVNNLGISSCLNTKDLEEKGKVYRGISCLYASDEITEDKGFRGIICSGPQSK